MNINEISNKLADQAEQIAGYLLPSGKKSSGEWKVGNANGEAGGSLSVRLTGAKAGVWKDFATGEGGDLIDLWAIVRGLSIAEAFAEAKQYLGIRDATIVRSDKSYKRPEKPRCQNAKGGVKDWLNGRGLTDKTIADFKIAEQIREGKTYAVFPYLRDGEFINVKYRNIAEKKDMRQEGGAEPCLFGWHLIDPKARTVAICEGEIDAMTLHQCGIPALSVNAGAGNHQWIASDWDRLERFGEIYICFDADEAGRKGAQEVITRLGTDRCKLVGFGAKDANEWLQSGATLEQFSSAISASKHVAPDEIKESMDFRTKLLALFYPQHDDLPSPQLQIDQKFPWFEFRAGELTVWTGYSGHGKSLLLSQVQLGLMSQGERFVVFSGEMSPERLLKRMVKQATGLDRPTVGYINAVFEWVNDKFWIFNHQGNTTLKRLLEVFTYANKRYGVRHFVVDSLMMTDVPEDGPGAFTAQKEAVRSLCDFAKRTGSHIHLVAHPRKGKDESGAPGKADVAGSSKITDGADNVLSVWRSQKDMAEPSQSDTEAYEKWVRIQESADAKLILRKQRNGDIQDFTLSLWFDTETMQYRCQKRNLKNIRFVDYTAPERV